MPAWTTGRIKVVVVVVLMVAAVAPPAPPAFVMVVMGTGEDERAKRKLSESHKEKNAISESTLAFQRAHLPAGILQVLY